MISTFAYHRVYARALLFILSNRTYPGKVNRKIEYRNRGYKHKMTFAVEKDSFAAFIK